MGYRIYRQYPLLGKYIVDFYIPSVRLVIEVDGITHRRGDQRSKDRRRDEDLLKHGYYTIRVTNEDVYQRPEKVLKYLFAVLSRLLAVSQQRPLPIPSSLPSNVAPSSEDPDHP